jgi:hypothetical protein
MRTISFCWIALWLALGTSLTVARAETVTATLTFADGDGSTVPISNAKVEIWRFRLRGPIFWQWCNDFTVTTDAAGKFNTSVPFAGTGVVYALRVFATNPSAQVFTQDVYTEPFYRQPGLPGPELQRTTTSVTNIHDFSVRFSDPWATNHFNVADAIQRGAAYAAARRDPRERDAIGQVTVLMNSVNSTFYDPVSKAIRMASTFAMDDFTILHEYAHYLEEQISSFYGIAAVHDGCTAVVAGVHVEEPGYAWMEGFASYFAQAVARSLPSGAINGPQSGTFSAAALERPSCPSSTLPRSSTELFVGAALFDLMDASPFEPLDSVCTSHFPADTVIFQIFDHELDIGWTNPTLQLFTNAWIDRGLPAPALTRTFAASSVSVVTPSPVLHYDSNPADNVAVWRPSTGVFWIHNGVPLVWGEPGDVPVPADYDGDGMTDVAIFRPRDGTWWIIYSASNRIAVTTWGVNGDIPLPGDYDGDGVAELAVFRPSTGDLWSHVGTCGVHAQRWVSFGTPVVGDFDRDGKDDPGAWDNLGRNFLILTSGAVSRRFLWSMPISGTPVVRDFDGDGRADVAVFDPATADWHIRSTAYGTVSVTNWGEIGAVPVPADYDGDGRIDLATWNPANGRWWVNGSRGPSIVLRWGEPGDVPVPAP